MDIDAPGHQCIRPDVKLLNVQNPFRGNISIPKIRRSDIINGGT